MSPRSENAKPTIGAFIVVVSMDAAAPLSRKVTLASTPMPQPLLARNLSSSSYVMNMSTTDCFCAPSCKPAEAPSAL